MPILEQRECARAKDAPQCDGDKSAEVDTNLSMTDHLARIPHHLCEIQLRAKANGIEQAFGDPTVAFTPHSANRRDQNPTDTFSGKFQTENAQIVPLKL